jgi:hypothetical protein
VSSASVSLRPAFVGSFVPSAGRTLGLTLRLRARIGAEVLRLQAGSAGERAGLAVGDVINLFDDVHASVEPLIAEPQIPDEPAAAGRPMSCSSSAASDSSARGGCCVRRCPNGVRHDRGSPARSVYPYGAWVLAARRVMLARQRVVAGRLAVAFAAAFTGGCVALARPGGVAAVCEPPIVTVSRYRD